MSGYNQGYGQGYPQQQGYAGYGAAPSGGYGAYGGYDASGYGRGAGMGWDRGAPGGGMMGMQGDYREARGPRPGYGGPAGSPMGAPMGGGGGFACVRLRGLPFGVTERDIVLFLGSEPIDILPVTRNARPTGEAFVVLRSLVDMDIALRKNKAYMGTRYIEVFEARKLEYYRAVAAAMGDGYDQPRRGRSPEHASRERSRSRSPRARAFSSTNILKLRGLPFSATADDVVAFFDDEQLGIPTLTSEQVTIAIAADGRPNGMAFVEFDSVESAEAAIKKDKQIMGSRYVEIFPSTAEERARHK